MAPKKAVLQRTPFPSEITPSLLEPYRTSDTHSKLRAALPRVRLISRTLPRGERRGVWVVKAGGQPVGIGVVTALHPPNRWHTLGTRATVALPGVTGTSVLQEEELPG